MDRSVETWWTQAATALVALTLGWLLVHLAISTFFRAPIGRRLAISLGVASLAAITAFVA